MFDLDSWDEGFKRVHKWVERFGIDYAMSFMDIYIETFLEMRFPSWFAYWGVVGMVDALDVHNQLSLSDYHNICHILSLFAAKYCK